MKNMEVNMIADLNLDEVLYVSGGATCPEGTKLESVVIEEGPNGTTTTTTCVATSTSSTISEGAGVVEAIGDAISSGWDAVTGFFGG